MLNKLCMESQIVPIESLIH